MVEYVASCLTFTVRTDDYDNRSLRLSCCYYFSFDQQKLFSFCSRSLVVTD